MRLFSVLVIALAFSLSACGTRSIGLVASSSPLAPGIVGTIPVWGSSCQYSILGVLPLGRVHSTQRALQEAKDDVGVHALTDVTIDETYHYFILFSRSCVYVEGLGVRN